MYLLFCPLPLAYLDCLVHVRERLVELPPVQLVLALLQHHPHSVPDTFCGVQGRRLAQHGSVVKRGDMRSDRVRSDYHSYEISQGLSVLVKSVLLYYLFLIMVVLMSFSPIAVAIFLSLSMYSSIRPD